MISADNNYKRFILKMDKDWGMKFENRKTIEVKFGKSYFISSKT